MTLSSLAQKEGALVVLMLFAPKREELVLLLAPTKEKRVVLMLLTATNLAAALVLMQRLSPMEEAIATLSLQMERTVQPCSCGARYFRRDSL
jgi:hypothetical protein